MTPARPLGTLADALALLARVLPLAAGADAGPLATALADGARALLRLPAAAIVPPAQVVETAARLRTDGDAVLAIALPGTDEPWTLVLAGPAGDLHAPGTTDLALILSAAAASAFAAQAEHAAQRREAALQDGLARAGQTLQESLDVSGLLTRICREAARVVEADAAVLLRHDGEVLAVEAVHGLPPEIVGWTTPAGPDAGAAGLALQEARAVRAAVPPAENPVWEDVAETIAVPLDWDGHLRGALCATYAAERRAASAHTDALERFAELAGVVFANASAHTGLAMTVRTDLVTGCLNHAALHDGLRREVERAERAHGGVLSLVLLDLELPGDGDEPIADEILRRTGHALRSTTRPYDLAARYGGAGFALVTVEADEVQASEIAARAIGRLSVALEDLTEGIGLASATAGVAQWSAGMTAGDLVARADRVLIYGRRAARRGEVLTEADLPPTFAPGRARRRERRLPAPPPTGAQPWTAAAADGLEPLRARARGLLFANRFAMRLADLDTVDEIVAATVEELREVFGYAEPGVLRTDDLGRVPAASSAGLLVPVARGEEPWGALVLRGPEPFGDDDQRLLETIAGHVGAAVAAVTRRQGGR